MIKNAHTKEGTFLRLSNPCSTVHRKYTTMKNNISKYKVHRPVDRDPSNPDFQAIGEEISKRSELRMKKREMKLK